MNPTKQKTLDDMTAPKRTELINLLCRRFGYQANIEDLDANGKAQYTIVEGQAPMVKMKANPETKADFVQRKGKEYLFQEAIRQHEQEKAEAARVAAKADF